MWIRISLDGQDELINCKKISKICICDNEIYINYEDSNYSIIYNESPKESQHIYEGLILAIQGIDFIVQDSDGIEIGYIKPLMQSKSAALYQYMKEKEYLDKRK